MSETATEAAKTQTEAESSSQQQTATDTGTTLLTATESEQKQASTEQKQEASTETNTEAAKTEETTETKTEEKKPDGAPEKYEFKDADKIDAKVLEAFTESAKEANLSQDAAQKLLDKVAPALQARTDEQVKQVHQQWTEASTTDKEFGGAKLKENLAVAKKGLDQFSTPELRTFLEASGLGSHPEVIRLLYRVGKAISEDTFVGGRKTQAQSPEEVFYPTMVKK
jgi:hypothetical protein